MKKMKNRLFGVVSALFFTVVSCTKDSETVKSDVVVSDQNSLAIEDSVNTDTISTPDNIPPFKVIPQDISAQKGLTVFTSNGNSLFYFDMNANKGLVKIDDQDIELNRADFNENNYSLFGEGVSIQATNGDFGEMLNGCISGTFPEVKIIYNGKTLNLAQVGVQDCPNY